MMSRIAGVLVVVGCSSSHHGAPADAAVTGHVSFVTGCAPAPSIAFAPTPPGETAMAAVFAINDSDENVVLGGLAEFRQITGADAADFTMTGAGEWCSFPVYYSGLVAYECCPGQVLAPHAWCQLTFEFHPTVLGSKEASYVVGGGAGVLPLSGTSVAQAATFHADRVNIAQGYIPTSPDHHSTTDQRPFTSPIGFKLINDSTATVNIGSLVVDPLFDATDDCPASLTPGGACDARVEIATTGAPPRIPECRTTMLTSTSSSLSVPVTYVPPPAPMPTTFGVTIIGDGPGSVESTPPGIDCVAGDPSPVCSFTSWAQPPSVALTATPASDAEIVGWFATTALLSPCGKAATCALPVPTASLFERTGSVLWVWLAPTSDKHVNVTIVGTGTVSLNSTIIDRSWTFDVPPGSPQTLGVTSGTFVGWSGDCSGTNQCQLGTVINDRNVTATFTP